MRKSTVYFFVVLTLLSLGLILVPSAFSQTSQTQDIKIVGYSYYFDHQGNLDVVGEVQNVGPNTITSVFLSRFNHRLKWCGSSRFLTQVWVHIPCSTAESALLHAVPFANNSPDGTWGTVKSLMLTSRFIAANATSSYQYPDLKITSESASIDKSGNYNGAYLVNGTIKNTGSQTAQNIWVVGTFYNSTGAVIAVGYTSYLTPASLSPSGKVSFRNSAFDLNQTSGAFSAKDLKLLTRSSEPATSSPRMHL